MLSLSAGALCSHRLLQNEEGAQLSYLAVGRRQAVQGKPSLHAAQARMVLPPVQRLRQRPHSCARQGRWAAASSSALSDSSRATSEAPVSVLEGRDQLQQQQEAGKRPTEPPVFDATQLLLGMGLPTSGADQLRQAISTLGITRQHGLVQHGSQVAAHLHSLGVGQQQLVRLVQRCPELFSWPAGERAAVLFGQLQQLGLTAAGAGQCFEQQTEAISAPTFQPAIDVLAVLYEAAGSKGSESGERLLGGLLRGQPAAVKLLSLKASTLQERIANLRRLDLSSAQIVAGLQQSWVLLGSSPGHLDKRQELLQQELGAGSEMFAKMLHLCPGVLSRSEQTLSQRARALLSVFGGEAALEVVGSSPGLLTVDSPIWQAALEVMRLVGVADPAAVAQRNATVLTFNWLDPRRLVNRLALQRCLGLTPAAVYQQYASYVAKTGSDRLVGRLLYLEQCGLLPLLVARKSPARQQWRREHGLPTTRGAPGEPAFISVSNLSGPDAPLLHLLQQNGCSADFAAFQAGLHGQPAWQQLWAAAVVEAAQLRAALPDNLRERLAVGGKGPAVDGGE